MAKERADPERGHMPCTEQTQVARDRPGCPGPLVLPDMPGTQPGAWQDLVLREMLPASPRSATRAPPLWGPAAASPGLPSPSHRMMHNPHNPCRPAPDLPLILGFLLPALPAAVASGGDTDSHHSCACAQLLPSRANSQPVPASSVCPRGACPGTGKAQPSWRPLILTSF